MRDESQDRERQGHECGEGLLLGEEVGAVQQYVAVLVDEKI